MVSHYEALGVPTSATGRDIREAWLSAARQHHPDRHMEAPPDVQADHARRMQVVNEAFRVLSDPSMRRYYDLELALGAPAEPAARPVEPVVTPSPGDPDPLSESPIPFRPGPVRRWWTLAPAWCLALAFGAFCGGVLFGSTQLWAFAVFCGVFGLAGFAVVQFMVMAGAGRHR